MEDDCNVDQLSLQVLLDLWDVAWGDAYVQTDVGDFWHRVGDRLYDANWLSRTPIHRMRADIFKRKAAVLAATTKE